MKSESEPPRKERCIQSKFSNVKKLATQFPHNLQARAIVANDAKVEIKSNAVRRDAPVNKETAATRYESPQNHLIDRSS